MVNIKLIIDAIAIPFGLIASIVIISRNKRNIANILIGLTAFLGGFVSVVFGLLKEIYFPINMDLTMIFVKLAFISLFSMSIPANSFSIFFWKARYKKIPNFLHSLTALPTIALSIWIFVDKDSIQYVSTEYGLNNFLTEPLIIYSLIIVFLTLILLVIELQFMAKNSKSFPHLKRRMHLFTAGFGIGFGGSFLSLFLFQYIFPDVIQPYSLFVIFSTISLTLAFSITLSEEEVSLWHGCPKLLENNGFGTMCANTKDGVPIDVKLLDIGNIIERIQIDAEVLKTGLDNCTNTVFCESDNIVRCLTTHEPILVLGEAVSREEMELARQMDVMDGNELCSSCLHKIIAYKKEHKEKTNAEIKLLFLGVRAEEFFGVS